jgi:two-component system phosphate regulon sensor histidine kinase PhoR
VKYNKDGGKVTVACSAENGNVVIKVADTGIGIAKKHLPHLFDEFYRIRDENTKRIGGTGLGLSIVKKIVDAYHGEISIESEEGKGSTFTVVLRGGVQ